MISRTPSHPPPPLPESIKREDIQKGRWGGKSEQNGIRLKIERLREHKRYCTFGVVLENTSSTPMTGPYVFHLHDTYPKSVIWIRKTHGRRAVLEQIEAIGVFTIGVQFRVKGQWQSLEYDLSSYSDDLSIKYPD